MLNQLLQKQHEQIFTSAFQSMCYIDSVNLRKVMEEIMASKSALPVYEVEFIPLERRLDDRRRHVDSCYSGPERRREKSRRSNERKAAKPRLHSMN